MTQRLELAIDGAGPERVLVAGKWVQLRGLGDGLRAIGIRRRVFLPSPGLHPGLAATDPLVIEWSWAGRAQRIALWAWRPGGGPYAGLPADDGDALERRRERIEIATHDGEVTGTAYRHEVRPFTIDLRPDVVYSNDGP